MGSQKRELSVGFSCYPFSRRFSWDPRASRFSVPEMGKPKWVTKNVSFSCQDPPPQIHQRRQLFSFPSAFRATLGIQL